MNQREANREAARLAAILLESESLRRNKEARSTTCTPRQTADLLRLSRGLYRLAKELAQRADPEQRKPKPDPVHPDQMTIEEVL